MENFQVFLRVRVNEDYTEKAELEVKRILKVRFWEISRFRVSAEGFGDKTTLAKSVGELVNFGKFSGFPKIEEGQ